MPKGHFAGVPRRRDKSVMHEEKKVKWNIMVTPTAKELISEAAKLQNFSASEFIERWARTQLVKNEEKPLEE
ncbi:MAG: hypothetical protein KME38_30765 [Spirirestis rafaelensis WJT71-NPBG6]|nr:hypothetical protein [Spirirestis rafaelensis WJT71-NPBG6]